MRNAVTSQPDGRDAKMRKRPSLGCGVISGRPRFLARSAMRIVSWS